MFLRNEDFTEFKKEIEAELFPRKGIIDEVQKAKILEMMEAAFYEGWEFGKKATRAKAYLEVLDFARKNLPLIDGDLSDKKVAINFAMAFGALVGDLRNFYKPVIDLNKWINTYKVWFIDDIIPKFAPELNQALFRILEKLIKNFAKLSVGLGDKQKTEYNRFLQSLFFAVKARI